MDFIAEVIARTETVENVWRGVVKDDALHLWGKKYPSLIHDDSEVHLGSYPLVNVRKWKYIE